MIAEQKILITASHGQLEAMIGRANENKAIFVMCHPHSQMGGAMGNKVVTTAIQAAQSLNYHTIRFNFRGVGDSSGSFDEGRGEQEDLAAAIQWGLTELGELPIIVGGFSFGAYVALQYCQQYTPAKLLLVAPPVQYPNFNSLHLPSCPSYLLTAAEDEVVPTDKIIDWARHENFTKTLNVAGASHFFHGKLLVLRDFVINMLMLDAVL